MKKMKKTKTSTSVALSPRADPSRQFCSSPSRPGRSWSWRERASRKASQRRQTTKIMIGLIAHLNADFRLANPKEFANLCSQVNFKVCKCFTIVLQKIILFVQIAIGIRNQIPNCNANAECKRDILIMRITQS